MLRHVPKPWGILLVVTLGAAILLAAAGIGYVHRVNGAILREAKLEAQDSAAGFAQAISAWILSDIYYYHLLDRVVEVMFQSGTLFIEIARTDEIIVDERVPSWEQRALPDSPSGLGTTRLHSVDDQLILDALVPIRPDQPTAGSVRIGTDAGSLGTRFRNVILSASLVALCLWLVPLSSATAWIRARQARGRQLASSIPMDDETSSSLDSAGLPLVIDSRAKCASYLDRELLLSPKPFLLLELLARDYGRVFDDQEIIDYVWTDAPYVNSNDVRQCIYRLRCRLNEVEVGLGDCIVNVKGFGYRFDPSKLQTVS